MDESFEIRLRNHKKEAVEMRVVEHLYRWSNWQITQTQRQVPEDGCEDDRVPRDGPAGWRKGSDLHGALFVVTRAIVPMAIESMT